MNTNQKNQIENNNENKNFIDQNNDLSLCLNLHSFLRGIANSFTLFLPIILIQYNNFLCAILHLISFMISATLINIIFYKFLKKYPLLCIMINYILVLISFIITAFAPLTYFTGIILGILNAFNNAFYNGPSHILVTANNRTGNFALFETFKTLGIIFMIFFNGYILNLQETFSIWLTCLVSGIIMIASCIPLIKIRKKIIIPNLQNEIKPKDIITQLRPYHAFNICFGLVHLVTKFLFPIFLFINNLTLDKIAYILIIIEILKILANYIATYLYKTNHSMLGIFIGCGMVAISVFTLLFSKDTILLYVCSILPGIAFPFFHLTAFKQYTIISKNFSADAIIIRETLIFMFRVVLLIPLLFGNYFNIVFIITIIICVLMIPFAIPYFKNNATKK